MKDQIYKPQRLKKINMKRLIILLSLVLICLVPFISAQQSQQQQQYSKIFLEPFYRELITQNIDYQYTLNFYSPDKVGEVYSAIISFNSYINPTRTFSLWVNGQTCKNPTFLVHTTYMGSGYGTVHFDCSNIIQREGTYNIILKVTGGNVGATIGHIDITYSNNPKGNVKVHGTEYNNKQQVKVWLQLIDNTGADVNDAVCYLTVYSPANTKYIDRSTMIGIGTDGIYYEDMASPAQAGVYPAVALCYYEAGQTFNYAMDYFVINGTYNAGTVANTYTIDGTFLRFKEANVGGTRRISAGLNFTNGSICTGISEELLTGITIRTVTKFDSEPNDDITLSVWNYTSSSWVDLPNKILEGNVYRDVSNSFATNNITKLGIVNSSGSGIRLRYTDTFLTKDGADSNLDIDYATVTCDQLSNPNWQEVKGSSEIHVTDIGDEPFYAETLCGTNENNGDTSSCATFENNLSVLNVTWGYIYDSIRFINSYQSDTNSFYEYETGLGQDCTGVFDIIRTDIDPAGSSYSFLNNVTMRIGTKDNCIIKIPVVFDSTDREFDIEIFQENYMVWESERARDLVSYYRLPIESFCTGIETASGNPFIVPITGGLDVSTVYASNPIYLGCYRTLDDLYWFDYYYDNGKLQNTSGNFESYLYNVRLYYEELKDGADAVLAITGQDVLVNVNSLCGSDVHKGYDYSCAEVRSPDAIFSSQEGYIFENLTMLNSFNITTSGQYSHYHYQTAKNVDCTAVFQVIKDNGTRTDITNEISYSAWLNDNCDLKIPVEYVEGQSSYQIEIYMENYILWDIYWARDNVNLWNDTIVPFCDNISANRSVNYILPINSSIEVYRNDSELYFCHRAMDDLYWWYFFYDNLQTELLSGTTIGHIESHRYESEFFWQRIFNHYNTVLSYNRNLNQILTLNEIYDLRDTLANRVWNFEGSRNLTDFNFSVNVTINTTEIIDGVWSASNRSLTYTDNIGYAVWNYSGTIGANVIQTLVNATWSYTGIISNELMANIGNATWTYAGDSTYMVNTIVNNTWTYTGGRYTHGEIIEYG
jgi:hypothetical protein